MSTTSKIIKVGAESKGIRLDIFLSEKLEMSRSQAQKMIDNEQITVNGKLPKKAGDKLSKNDVIRILSFRPSERSERAEESLKSSERDSSTALRFARNDSRPPNTAAIKIIEATHDYIVVEKPAGLLTHPTMAKEKVSLSGYLLEKYPEIKNIGEDPMRPGIVHRLDKEASGLLVVAHTQPMFNHLKEQFKSRTIIKEYLVLTHGRFEREWGEINFPLKRSESGDRMAAVPLSGKKALDEEVKTAKTEFVVEKQFVNFALLRVKIYTGRMHQIRAHLLAYNHPVVGDELYFQKKQKRAWDKKLGRLFLHCTKLVFNDLEGVPREYNSPLPPELQDFLGQIT